MTEIDLARPFPDYVTCPDCNEPEVEVWCYAVEAKCHNCGHTFDHPLPVKCQSTCNVELRAQAARVSPRPLHAKTCADVVNHSGGSAGT